MPWESFRLRLHPPTPVRQPGDATIKSAAAYFIVASRKAVASC